MHVHGHVCKSHINNTSMPCLVGTKKGAHFFKDNSCDTSHSTIAFTAAYVKVAVLLARAVISRAICIDAAVHADFARVPSAAAAAAATPAKGG